MLESAIEHVARLPVALPSMPAVEAAGGVRPLESGSLKGSDPYPVLDFAPWTINVKRTDPAGLNVCTRA